MLPVATHYLTASILTLVLPVGVFISVIAWFGVLWRRGAGER